MQNISKGYIYFNEDKLKDVLGLPKEVLLSDVKIDHKGVTLSVLSAGNVTVGEQQVTYTVNNLHENIRRVNGFNLAKEIRVANTSNGAEWFSDGVFETLENREAIRVVSSEVSFYLDAFAEVIREAMEKGAHSTSLFVEEEYVAEVKKELLAKGYSVSVNTAVADIKVIQVKW